MGSTMHSPDGSQLESDAPRERHLAAVPNDGPIATERAGRPKMHPIGRAGVVGGLLGLTCSATFVFVVSVASGMKPGDAIGLALWAGIWGGIGFGAMVGLVVGANIEEKRERQSVRPSATSGTLGRHA